MNYTMHYKGACVLPHPPLKPVFFKILLAMKLALLLTLVFTIQVTAGLRSQTITLSFEQATLESVLAEIKKQSGYNFIIKSEALKNADKVSVSISDLDIKAALKAVLANQPFTYEIKGKTIVIDEKTVEREKSVLAISQDSIRGRVIDENGEPLAGATVRVKDTNIRVITDQVGYFALPTIYSEATLQVSYIGYGLIEITAQKASQIVLSADQSAIEEIDVVNTGYQSLPQERATGSFSFVDNDLLNKRVSTNIIDRLEGNVPGLIFHKNTSASADGGIDINIRGHSTLFANDQPLIVVDNFPYDGLLSNINPNDIETVTVLKDAAASSIWGVKSGNGVIVITTKKGSIDKPLNLEFNSNLTVGGRPDLFYKPLGRIASSDRVDIQTMLYEQGYYASQLTSTNYPAIPLAVSILDKMEKGLLSQNDGSNLLQNLRNNDVRNDLQDHFYQPMINQQYALSFRGGSRNSDYYLSSGYDSNRPNQVGFNNERLNLTSNLNLYPTNKLTISANLNLTFTQLKTNSVLTDLNTLITSGQLSEYTDLVDDQTSQSLAIIRNHNPIYLESIENQGFRDWYYRPYDEISLADNRSRQLHNRINLGLDYKIISGLSASLKYQYEKGTTESDDFRGPETYYTRNLINRFYNPEGTVLYPVPSNGGILIENNANLNSHRGRFQLDYQKRWSDDHDFVALTGAEINETVTDSRTNTVYGFNPENLTFVNVDFLTPYATNPDGSQLIPNNNSIGKFNDRYVSYFANGSYTYLNRYILSASGRIDRSNLFGVRTNQRTAPLYSIGIAWDISKEDFYNLYFLPYSKLRVTYGYSGNIDKSASAYNTFLALSGGSQLYGLPQAVIQRPGNDELRWEKVRTINIAYDFKLRNDRLNGGFEFYFKNGIDLFGNSPLPGSTGFTVFYGNTASTSTKGFDINLNSINVSNTSFKWTSNLLISRTLDIVTDYEIEEQPVSYITGIRSSIVQPLVGKPLFSVYSYPWAGLSSENGDPQGYLNGEVSTDWTGILANTTIDNMKYNGPARPVHFGSVRNTFSYRGFSLSANVLYKLGYYFRRNSISYAGLYAGSGHSDYYNRWQQPGDESATDVPSLQTLPIQPNRGEFYAYSEVLVEKGDHIRLQDISLSYNLSVNGKSLNIYSNVNNVGIMWRANEHHFDPDVYIGSLPSVRLYSLGAKLLF